MLSFSGIIKFKLKVSFRRRLTLGGGWSDESQTQGSERASLQLSSRESPFSHRLGFPFATCTSMETSPFLAGDEECSLDVSRRDGRPPGGLRAGPFLLPGL